MVNLKKDISVITKLALSREFIGKLKDIDLRLNQNNNLLAFSVTIPCLESAQKWEPRVPGPKKRIETLKRAFDAGIKTMVAVRPLLPTLPDSEIRNIVESTKDHCLGYYSGPLYLKDLTHPLISKDIISSLKIDRLQPHWMTKGNIFYKIEKEGQMDLLNDILQKYNKPLFEGAAEGIKYLKTL